MFWRRKTSVSKPSGPLTFEYGALIMGPPSFALLALHRDGPALAAIVDSIPDSQYMPSIAGMTDTGIALDLLDPDAYPEWSLRPYTVKLTKGRSGLITDELLARSKLAVARANAIHRIIFEINRIRAKIDVGVTLQETVYMTKKTEALAFKADGYDESQLIRFPYLLQYADLYGMSGKEAADNVIFRAGLDDALMAKSETLRMKYFDLVKQTTDLREFPALMRRFYYESSTKQLV